MSDGLVIVSLLYITYMYIYIFAYIYIYNKYIYIYIYIYIKGILNVQLLVTGEKLYINIRRVRSFWKIGMRFVSNRERPVKENTTQSRQAPIRLLGTREKNIRNYIFTKYF